MPSKKKKEFQMTPQLEKFKYEVAQEIGIADKIAKENKQQHFNKLNNQKNK